jgi:hypothetical protein
MRTLSLIALLLVALGGSAAPAQTSGAPFALHLEGDLAGGAIDGEAGRFVYGASVGATAQVGPILVVGDVNGWTYGDQDDQPYRYDRSDDVCRGGAGQRVPRRRCFPPDVLGAASLSASLIAPGSGFSIGLGGQVGASPAPFLVLGWRSAPGFTFDDADAADASGGAYRVGVRARIGTQFLGASLVLEFPL